MAYIGKSLSTGAGGYIGTGLDGAIRARFLTNGAMQVAQRGTSSTTSGYGTVDRFRTEFAGVSVTQSQESLSSGDPYDDGFRNFLRATNTSVSSATSAFLQMYQFVEAQNLANSGWNATSSTSFVTYSFWVRSSLAGTYYINIRSQDGTSQNFSSPVVLVANTWKKVTLPIPGNSNITIDNNNGAGLFIGIIPHYGTDYTTSGHTADAWAAYSGTDITPDYSQSWTNTASATFDITGVQLELGDTATPFEHRSYGDELFSCQRYYQRTQFFMGAGHSVSGVVGMSNLHRAMRANPTLSQDGVFVITDGYSIDATQSSTGATITSNNINTTGYYLYIQNISGLTAGKPYMSRLSNANGLLYDAEL
tara:strand:+ start:339 stop:1430 length:1092 start_codon:yes stop_codon:yes gene_type:complete